MIKTLQTWYQLRAKLCKFRYELKTNYLKVKAELEVWVFERKKHIYEKTKQPNKP